MPHAEQRPNESVFSLWGNSLLSLMPTVVVAYWGLAWLPGLGGKRAGMRVGADGKCVLPVN